MCNDCHSDLCMCYVLHALSNYFDFQHPQIEQRPDALEFLKVHFGQLQCPSEAVSDDFLLPRDGVPVSSPVVKSIISDVLVFEEYEDEDEDEDDDEDDDDDDDDDDDEVE